MRLVRAVCKGGLALLLLLLAGCGDRGMAEVKGTVTVDGAPLDNGAISFFPVNRKTKTSGGSIKAGQYDVEVPPGEMLVSINAPKFVRKEKLYDTPDSRERDVFEESLPAKYNVQTELRLEVTPGTINKDWDLTRK